MVQLKYLSTFWSTLVTPLINCEINLILTWSANFLIIDAPVQNQVRTFEITDTKLYVPVATLSTQGNSKLLQQLKLCFKRTSKWNKYQSKVPVQERNRCLDYLTAPSFQRVNWIFVLSFENNTVRVSCKRYYLPQSEIRDYSVLTDE